MVEEELSFYTSWDLEEEDPDGKIIATQEVQIQGMNDSMHNQFCITDRTSSQFSIELENAALGTIIGKGVIKEGLIAWEFVNNDMDFEGFEFYEKQEDGSYLMRAEYVTPEQYRTTIRGRIWEKQDEEETK